MRKSIFLIQFLIVVLATSLSYGQLISIKSVPVATGDQFLIFPSQNLGMGGVSAALNDTLLDPFSNPAKGARIKESVFYSCPTYYTMTGNNGGAQSLPVGLLTGGVTWFGGASFSIQQVRPGDWNGWGGQRLSDRASNFIGSAYFGLKFPRSKTSVGAGIMVADLDGIDGVDMLYADASSIEQNGKIIDVQAGLLHEWNDGRALDFVLLYHYVDMVHDVTYEDWISDPLIDSFTWETRKEKNKDRTKTYGLHLGYRKPVTTSGWDFGVFLTGNWKTHPKIPNYDIMRIPRDPGNSSAYHIGFGLARSKGRAKFGFDVIFEPIWSNTWAEAIEEMETPSGGMLYPGDRTVENDFKFSNAMIRLGLSRDTDKTGFQIGLQSRTIDYRLKQVNHVEEFERKQNESWTEWTASLGLTLKFQEFDIRYLGRMTLGTGRPGIDVGRGNMLFATDEAMSDIVLAPSGDLTLSDVTVWTHRVMVTLPLN